MPLVFRERERIIMTWRRAQSRCQQVHLLYLVYAVSPDANYKKSSKQSILIVISSLNIVYYLFLFFSPHRGPASSPSVPGSLSRSRYYSSTTGPAACVTATTRRSLLAEYYTILQYIQRERDCVKKELANSACFLHLQKSASTSFNFWKQCKNAHTHTHTRNHASLE